MGTGCRPPRLKRGFRSWIGLPALVALLLGSGCERDRSLVGPSRLRGRIVYNAIQNFTSQIQVIFPDDPANPRRLIDSRTDDVAPRWSPDGSQIAFLSDREGAPGFFRLYVMNADGSNIRELFDPVVDPEGDLEFSWAPDGRHIALINRVRPPRTDRRQLFILNVETLERQLIAPSLPDRFSPDWSPDGARIAFVSDSPTTAPTLNLITYPDLVIRVINVDLGRMNFPRWSPDGHALAFVGAPDDNTPYQLFMAEGPVFTVRQISHIEGGIPNPSPLTWSPDGQRLVFSAPGTNVFEKNSRDLYAIHIDGTALLRLTTNPTDETAPDWTIHEP